MIRPLLPVSCALAAVLAALSATGCLSRRQAPADFVRAHLATRLRSLSGFPTADFPPGDARLFVGVRTVFLATSPGPVRLVPNPAGPWADGPMVIGSSSDRIGFGMGAVIDRRGYILTANHVLGSARSIQAVWADETVVRLAAARVVWRSQPGRGEPDLALLHVPGAWAGAFDWSERPGTTGAVLGIGSSWVDDAQRHGDFRFQFYAGTVTGWHSGGDGRSQTVTHTAPSFPGDSGGPLLDAHGRLLAIATHGGLSYETGVATSAAADAYGTGIRPDPAWLRGLIEADATRQPAAR